MERDLCPELLVPNIIKHEQRRDIYIYVCSKKKTKKKNKKPWIISSEKLNICVTRFVPDRFPKSGRKLRESRDTPEFGVCEEKRFDLSPPILILTHQITPNPNLLRIENSLCLSTNSIHSGKSRKKTKTTIYIPKFPSQVGGKQRLLLRHCSQPNCSPSTYTKVEPNQITF